MIKIIKDILKDFLNHYTRTGLINLLNTLNIPIIGNELDQQLKDLIVQELDRRGKLLICH